MNEYDDSKCQDWLNNLPDIEKKEEDAEGLLIDFIGNIQC